GAASDFGDAVETEGGVAPCILGAIADAATAHILTVDLPVAVVVHAIGASRRSALPRRLLAAAVAGGGAGRNHATAVLVVAVDVAVVVVVAAVSARGGAVLRFWATGRSAAGGPRGAAVASARCTARSPTPCGATASRAAS